jgi:hypothetical protein
MMLFFQAVGIATCSVGAFGVMGFLLYWGLEQWIELNELRKPFLERYWQKLKSEKEENSAG